MAVDDQLFRVHVCYSRPESEVIRSMLIAYGIPVFVRARHFADVNPFMLVALNGLRIEVPFSVRIEAARLIRDVSGVVTLPESKAFRAHWIVFSAVLAASLYLGIPYFPIWLHWRNDVSSEIAELSR
jgi:hypothetical protein